MTNRKQLWIYCGWIFISAEDGLSLQITWRCVEKRKVGIKRSLTVKVTVENLNNDLRQYVGNNKWRLEIATTLDKKYQK